MASEEKNYKRTKGTGAPMKKYKKGTGNKQVGSNTVKRMRGLGDSLIAARYTDRRLIKIKTKKGKEKPSTHFKSGTIISINIKI